MPDAGRKKEYPYFCRRYPIFIFRPKCDFTNMGKGDFKSKRGKIRRGSHGNNRPKSSKLRAAKKKAQ